MERTKEDALYVLSVAQDNLEKELKANLFLRRINPDVPNQDEVKTILNLRMEDLLDAITYAKDYMYKTYRCNTCGTITSNRLCLNYCPICGEKIK